LVSGMSVTSTASESQTTVRLRGIGTVGDNPGLESSVGVVIDGVYRPRNGVGFGDLGPVERVEVLKGPQGTVFGKNTSAGLVNVVTRAPSYNQSVEAEVTAGNYGLFGVAASYNDALSDTAAFSLYGVKRWRDGFLDVETGAGPRTSREDNNLDFHGLRGQLLLEPTDGLRLRQPQRGMLRLGDHDARTDRGHRRRAGRGRGRHPGSGSLAAPGLQQRHHPPVGGGQGLVGTGRLGHAVAGRGHPDLDHRDAR